MTPWQTTMCYPLQEMSQTERETRPGKGAEDCLTSSCQREKKKISRNEKRCTVHKQHSSCEYNHDESGGDTKSLQRSLYQRRDNSVLTHSITITQLDLYLQCTNESFSLTPFSPARYSSLALPHSVTPLHSHAHTSLHS